jgi:hypothetical protein
MEFTFQHDSARIRLAHQRLKAAYELEPGAQTPVVEPGGYARQHCFQELFADLDKMLDHAVRWANAMAATGSDWPPFIDTYCGVVMVAEAFGCEVVFTPGSDPWTRSAVPDLNHVWNLKPKKLEETPTIRRLSEWVDYAQRKIGTDLPIWTMDVQSPFSVAARVVESTELLIGCITDPKAVHHLCDMITDVSIEMIRRHLAQMEHPGFPGRNFPSISEDIGICIADDTPLIMLSPEMYREFALPYNSRIGEAFGGVHLHSCGDYRANLDNTLDIKNLRSIQLHAGQGEFPLPESSAEDCPFNHARGKVAMLVDTNGIARADAYRNRPREHYAEYVLPRLLNGSMDGVILQSCGAGGDMPDLPAALEWTRRQVKNGRGAVA